MKNYLEKSEKLQLEYCCTVVRIGKLNPIENSDFLATTLVNGIQIVVRKDEMSEGDLRIYAANETQLNKSFLSANNLFELGERSLNKNYQEVQSLLDEGKEEEAKRKVGFFNKHGRVKCIRLRKQPSFGFLFDKESLVNWKPELKDLDLSDYEGQDFDTICGELFVKVYIPYNPEEHKHTPQPKDKETKKFDCIIEGEFAKHFETQQLQRNIDRLKPTDTVDISVKVHGTSAIYANIKCRVPRLLKTRFEKLNNFVNYLHLCLPDRLRIVDEKYDLIYSSRNVIKNRFLKVSRKKNSNPGFYGTDVWEKYAKLLKPYIPEGMTVYGEIYGYLDNDTKMIQKDYDYGCEVGKNKFMPYRITTTNEDGTKKEWNVCDVKKWTIELISNHEELIDEIHIIDTLWHGTLKDFYPGIPEDENWCSNVLEALKTEKRFGMEKNEPLCKSHKVPREGFVLRIDNDPLKEAFKLKCVSFFERECKLMDAGEVDMEMQQIEENL